MITALTSTDQNQDPSQNIPQNQIMHQNPDGEQIEQVQDREREKRQNTQCKNCFISIPFDYFGMTPPFAPKVMYVHVYTYICLYVFVFIYLFFS